MNFRELITENPIIIETLFHLKEYNISIATQDKRIIHKYSNFNHIYKYAPLLKDVFADIINQLFKDEKNITYIITENYDDLKKSFNYEIKIKEHPIFNNYNFIYQFVFNLTLELDKYDKNKINIFMTSNSNEIELNDSNPIKQAIFYVIKNYLKNDHTNYVKKEIFENNLKKIFNHHSFELNII